jgi:hypothetical protein
MIKKKNIEKGGSTPAWESTRLHVVRNNLDNPNSITSIQGALRITEIPMKGTTTATTVSSTTFPRYINLDGKNVASNPNVIAKSVRIYTNVSTNARSDASSINTAKKN